jgi:hypothetical protein
MASSRGQEAAVSIGYPRVRLGGILAVWAAILAAIIRF